MHYAQLNNYKRKFFKSILHSLLLRRTPEYTYRVVENPVVINRHWYNIHIYICTHIFLGMHMHLYLLKCLQIFFIIFTNSSIVFILHVTWLILSLVMKHDFFLSRLDVMNSASFLDSPGKWKHSQQTVKDSYVGRVFIINKNLTLP